MLKAQPGTKEPLHTICQRLIGSWVQESTENFDNYMKALGTGDKTLMVTTIIFLVPTLYTFI